MSRDQFLCLLKILHFNTNKVTTESDGKFVICLDKVFKRYFILPKIYVSMRVYSYIREDYHLNNTFPLKETGLESNRLFYVIPTQSGFV